MIMYQDSNMSEIVKLSELDGNQLDQAIDVFIEGFYNTLKSVTKDKAKIHRLFRNTFDCDMTYAYLHDGNTVGFLGLADHKKRPIKLSKEVFIEELGGFTGKMSYNAVSAAMEKIKVDNPEEVCIDYIATHPEYRSMGIGKKLIEYVRDNLDYRYIWLEVSSTNPRAVAFYEREGFKKTSVKTNLLVMLQGFGKTITMTMEVEQ